MTNLFSLGSFKLHSGRNSFYKIDCDSLTDQDLQCVAYLLKNLVGPFSSVEGVPEGGLRLAYAMRVYQKRVGPLLIVDDVYTSGVSMEEHRAGRDAVGAVIFARLKPADWVTPLFQQTAPNVARLIEEIKTTNA